MIAKQNSNSPRFQARKSSLTYKKKSHSKGQKNPHSTRMQKEELEERLDLDQEVLQLTM